MLNNLQEFAGNTFQAADQYIHQTAGQKKEAKSNIKKICQALLGEDGTAEFPESYF